MEYAIVTDYTVGFMFNEKRDGVILMEKNRPEWQKGLKNGVGGHINDNETARQGMVREFLEETGAQTEEKDWQCFCRLTCTDPDPSHSSGAMVYMFSAFNDTAFNDAHTAEDEVVGRYTIDSLRTLKTVLNLQWLIPLALYHEAKFPVHVIE